MHADACNFHALRLHACLHCAIQLAADCHWIHSNCDKNFAGRRSLEKLYNLYVLETLFLGFLN